MQEQTETRKASFDLTDFGNSRRFGAVLETLDIPISSGYREGSRFYWESKHGEGFLVTGNNPLTGEYGHEGMREDQYGYASYVGIEGSEMFVNRAIDAIVKHSKFTKDIDRKARSFI